MQRQTKVESFIEALVNTAVGFLITMFFLPIVNRIIGLEMSVVQMGLSTFLFTIISVARSYFIRRFFANNIGKYLLNKIKRK